MFRSHFSMLPKRFKPELAVVDSGKVERRSNIVSLYISRYDIRTVTDLSLWSSILWKTWKGLKKACFELCKQQCPKFPMNQPTNFGYMATKKKQLILHDTNSCFRKHRQQRTTNKLRKYSQSFLKPFSSNLQLLQNRLMLNLP